jgi:mono/diheme cytochrome c family protein
LGLLSVILVGVGLTLRAPAPAALVAGPGPLPMPPTDDPRALARGAEVVAGVGGCAGCHGADGDSGYAPNLSAEVPGEAVDETNAHCACVLARQPAQH